MAGKIYTIDEKSQVDAELSLGDFQKLFKDTIDEEDETIRQLKKDVQSGVHVLLRFTLDGDLMVFHLERKLKIGEKIFLPN